MAHPAYDRLTALDNSFLVLEQPNAYMHVASTQILAAGSLRHPDGGIDAAAFRRRIAAALPGIPRYRQKLAYIPLENHPVWVDDDCFNLDYHIRHTSLPRPGTEQQLKRLSARVMQQHLDRSRPLWEMWLVEGLQDDRFAIILKVHHCMIDGIAGVDLLKVLMSPTPEESVPEPPAFYPRPAPSRFQLWQDETARRLRLPLDALRGLASLAREGEDLRRELLVRAQAVAETLLGSLRRPSQTPFNHPIGPHRRFDWCSMPLRDLKAVRKSLGGSLNDVVLATVAGAVRRYLIHRRVNPDKVAFRIMAPVSVRKDEEREQTGNRISAWFLDLPIAESDPVRRLRRIAAETARLKGRQRAVGAEVLTRAAEFTPATLLSLGARSISRLLPFNMVVTNVPGPQSPMYTLGSPMLEIYPHVPLMDRLGLGVALMSYDGRLFWGINADFDLVPDLEIFVESIQRSFEDLRGEADVSPPAL